MSGFVQMAETNANEGAHRFLAREVLRTQEALPRFFRRPFGDQMTSLVVLSRA